MRWMKHLTVAHDDPAISVLLEQMGPEGYGIYWLLLEHLAIGIEKDSAAIPSRSHTDLRWSQICHTSTRTFRKFYETACKLCLIEGNTVSELRRFCDNRVSNLLQIDIPKLLKYRDEYSKKSGQCTPQIENTDRDRKQKERKQTLSPASAARVAEDAAILSWYNDEFYPRFPLHKAKQEGLKAARSKLRTGELRMRALKALSDQLPELLQREPSRRPYPATWINGGRWEDEPLPLFSPTPALQPVRETATERAIRIGHERIMEHGRL